MPELPEVETMRRGVEPAVGATITTVERLPSPRKPIEITPGLAAFKRRAEGARIERTARAGKRVVLWTDRGDAIIFEPRMTGLLLLDNPPDPIYSRFRLRLCGGKAKQIIYWDRRGLGIVRLLSERQFNSLYGPDKLGPDALDMTAELYRERLGRSQRAIKVALLDQRAVAGIGNLYASEILHLAGVHPARPCRQITRRQWDAITSAAKEVLNTAIRYEGSTLNDGTYRNALNNAGATRTNTKSTTKPAAPAHAAKTASSSASSRPSARLSFVPAARRDSRKEAQKAQKGRIGGQ